MTAKVANFHWYLPDRIAGGSKPSSSEEVKWLANKGISCVLSLETVNAAVERAFAEHKITRLYMPVDLEEQEVILPSDADLLQAAMFVKVALKAKRRVYIHCSVGTVRTPAIAQMIIDRVVEG